MRAVNERLGYEYRDVAMTMVRPLPLEHGREARGRDAALLRARRSSSRMPTWVVMAVYLVQELHLSPLQLVLMGTAMEAAVFLFEIPTGVVADTYSRRLSLIVGYVGMGLDLDARRHRLGAVADHRALGSLGPLVHVHERCRRGLDHRRGRGRQGRPGLPARRACPRTSARFSGSFCRSRSGSCRCALA